MSFPGVPGAQDDQQQSPLFGQPTVSPEMLQLRQALAQQMMQGQNQPIASREQLAAHVVSPLIGILMQRRLAKQQDALQADMATQLPAILKSDDPLSAMAASSNPLIRQMMAQALPEYLKSGFDTRAAVQKETQSGPINTKNAVDLATQTEPIEAKKAGDIARAQIPAEVAKAQALLPIELAKVRAGQAATYAGQAETARHNKIMEGIQGGGLLGVGGPNPWEQKWGP